MMLSYCPVGRMIPGDTFLSNRSGMLTVVSHPRPNPDGGTSRVIDVRKTDGTVFTLIGVNLYTVTRSTVAAYCEDHS